GVLLLLAIAPAQLSGRADWMLQPQPPPLLLRPVGWFVAAHASIAGRVLHAVPDRDMPPPLALEERRFRSEYERNLPRWTASAAQGAVALALLLAGSLAMYVWNARHLHVLADQGPSAGGISLARLCDRIARTLIPSPPLRGGFLLLFRTMLRSSLHRLYLLVAL